MCDLDSPLCKILLQSFWLSFGLSQLVHLNIISTFCALIGAFLISKSMSALTCVNKYQISSIRKYVDNSRFYFLFLWNLIVKFVLFSFFSWHSKWFCFVQSTCVRTNQSRALCVDYLWELKVSTFRLRFFLILIRSKTGFFQISVNISEYFVAQTNVW